jgi:peptidoglycan hydrolase CwlO-like protein
MMLLMYLMFIITMNNQLNNSRYIITFNSYYLEMSILDNYYWEWKSIRDKITELEEENRKLKEETETLKDKIEFLTQCLDDRDKSIEIMKEELWKFIMKS